MLGLYFPYLPWINKKTLTAGWCGILTISVHWKQHFFSFLYCSSHQCATQEPRVNPIALKCKTLHTVVYLCTSNIQEKLLCLLARKRRSLASSSRHMDLRCWNAARAAWRAKISFTAWKGKGKSENMMEIVTQRLFSKQQWITSVLPLSVLGAFQKLHGFSNIPEDKSWICSRFSTFLQNWHFNKSRKNIWTQNLHTTEAILGLRQEHLLWQSVCSLIAIDRWMKLLTWLLQEHSD